MSSYNKMKICFFLIIAFAFFSCSESKDTPPAQKEGTRTENKLIEPAIKSIIDSSGVAGSILIYDPQKEVYYSNDFAWAEIGRLPASTFKITNSIIALESGAVENDSTVFKWDGKKRRFKIWEQDLIFRDAFRFSCVPCYQDVARRIGPKRMNEYLAKLRYGNMDVDSSNIDVFWLEGNSRISQFQQIHFLKRFYNSQLPISERTEKTVKRMMVMDNNEDYILSGKTGWSIRGGHNNGWFVGFVEKGNQVFYFATNIEPAEQFDMKRFPKTRKEITYRALKKMDITGLAGK